MMTKKQLEIISDKSSEKLHKRVDDFLKDVKVIKINYEPILGGKEFYAHIYYEGIKENE
jgi:hypothetical protein